MQFLHGGNSEPCVVQSQHWAHLGVNSEQAAAAALTIHPPRGRAQAAQEKETTMAYASDIRTVQNGIMDRVNAAIKAFAEAREQRRVYNQTMRELSGLNNRELADLGISAAEIPYIAREAAYGAK